MKGIDVAKWNCNIDWKRVKSDGVKFAILKAINKQNNVEDAFERNYKGAQSVGIPTDVYNYLYTTTTQQAVATANKVVSVIKGKNIKVVWADAEDKTLQGLGINLINILNAYKEVIEKAGYSFGVYTGLSFYNSYIRPYADKIDCPFWIARYYKSYNEMDFAEEPDKNFKPNISHRLVGWQYTSSGIVDGINDTVDLDKKYDSATQEIPTLRLNSRSVYVKQLQEKLNSLGYDCGNADGIFGSKTEKAVEQFQKVNNLTVDGVVGVRTWAKLDDRPIQNPIMAYSIARDSKVKLSPNFTVKEFACKDGTDKVLIDVDFVKKYLQQIRNHFRVPITINSAYRTESYNKKVGGASASYHVKGQAFDIVVKGVTPQEVAKYAYSIGVTGIIQYNTFVHLDNRKTPYYAINNNGKVTKINKF